MKKYWKIMSRTSASQPALPINPKNDVSIKKPALTPALSLRRGRNGFRVRARVETILSTEQTTDPPR